MTRTLDELVDDAALVSTEHQDHLTDLHGRDSWNVEFTEERFWFTSEDGTVTDCPFQFVGSAAPGPASWRWGWRNDNGFGDDLLVAARVARDSGVPQLAVAELPLPAARRPDAIDDFVQGPPMAPGPRRSPVLDDELPHRLTVATKELTGRYLHYSPLVTGGTQIWLLLDVPGFEPPAPTVPHVARIITKALGQVRITDARRALGSYASRRGIGTRWTREGIDLALPDGTLRVALDPLDRIVEVTGTPG